jgi:hypothetical protein
MADNSIIDVASFMLGCLGGAFGLWQYYRSNKEARARAAADELERFHADDQVKTALRIIDWHSGSIAYVDEAGVRHKRHFSALDFHLALRPHSKLRTAVRNYDAAEDLYRAKHIEQGIPCDDLFSPVESYVRDVVDGFLGRLERIESLISSGVVDQKSFGENFSYWLRIIGDPRTPDDHLHNFSSDKQEALLEYIRYYEFTGVRKLFARYGKAI